MRNLIAPALIGLLALSLASPTLAKGSVSQREYKRGYKDCLAGRWDQEQHGVSYKAGCRAAEDKRGPAKGECPPDVSEAERYKYPACN